MRIPDIYVYFVHMPPKTHEIVLPCLDGYTVYIDESLDQQARLRSYRHAVQHIMQMDFEKESVQKIETERHNL